MESQGLVEDKSRVQVQAQGQGVGRGGSGRGRGGHREVLSLVPLGKGDVR